MSTITFDFRHHYQRGERRESEQIAYQWDLGHVMNVFVPEDATYTIGYCFGDYEKTEDYAIDTKVQEQDGSYKLTAHIPNKYFERSRELRVYVVGSADDHIITTYEGFITVRGRLMPDDYVDDDPENGATQIIEVAREYATKSESFAVGGTGTRLGEDTDNAKYYLEQAEAVAESIQEDYSELSDDVDQLKNALTAVEIVDTASGAIATFPDGADNFPVKDLKVWIEPVQDLHGYDHPWPGGGGVNLLDLSSISTETKNGVTYTVYKNDEGAVTRVHAEGTASQNAIGQYFVSLSFPFDVIISGSGTNASVDCNSGTYLEGTTIPANTEITNIRFRVGSGKTVNTDLYPMLREATEADATFAPYTNICPISGRTGVTVSHSGSDTSDPTTISVTFPSEAGTVYGGTLDVTNGVLTVTHGNIVSYNGESLPGRWISSMDVYSTGGTPTTGAQVVYELATPVTYTLTPQQVTTLLGLNYIWSDADSVSVDYVADTKLYIEQLTEPDADMVADMNITSGKYFMVGNSLYLATANIANGSAIVVGTNCTRTNLAEALNAINA